MKKIKTKIFDYDVELNIDKHLTLISGDSGVGKTLLFNFFDRQSYGDENIKCFNAKYMEKLRTKNEEVENALLNQIKQCKQCLIVIDNVETLLDDNLRKHIIFDGENTYMLFGRNVDGLWITEENYANLVRNDKSKRMYLEYVFKDVNNHDRNMDGRQYSRIQFCQKDKQN